MHYLIPIYLRWEQRLRFEHYECVVWLNRVSLESETCLPVFVCLLTCLMPPSLDLYK